MKRICIGLICVVFLCGCEAVNSGLNAVNEALTAGNSSTGTGSTSSSTTVSVPESVKQATISSFTKLEDKKLQMLVDEAKPTIVEMVSRAACGTDSRVMGRYTDPDSFTMSYVNPMVGMSYHKSGCLNPVRIQGWDKVAANAIKFSVVYMSPQSEETTRRSYTAVKQPDGIWLFKW